MSKLCALWRVITGQAAAEDMRLHHRLSAVEERVTALERKSVMGSAIHDLTEGKGE